MSLPDASPPASPAPSPPVRLLSILAVFLRIGALSFGGGLSGWIFRETVTLRQWLTEEEFFSGLALSQMLPGVNVANMAITIGQRLRGVRGAVIALLGLLAVPFGAVIGLVLVYDRIKDIAFIPSAMDGLAAAALGLLALVGARAATSSGTSLTSVLALIATFVAVGLLRLPLVPVVLVIAPLSVAAAWFTRPRRHA